MTGREEERKVIPVPPTTTHPPLRQKHKLLILEDNVLLSLGRHTLFVQEFPFLSKLEVMYKSYGNNVNKKGCGCGGGGSNTGSNSGMSEETKRHILNEIKKEIISSSQEKKNKFKEMLNTELVRIFYLGNDGKVTIETF